MASETEKIRLKILQVIADTGLFRIKSVTRSETVKKYLYNRITGKGVTFIVPHYWIPYYHDGRGGFGPKDQPYLVYYRNPRDDPRIAGGYPLRRSDTKKLTPSQFREGMRTNYALYRKNPGGGRFQHMVVKGLAGGSKRVGPTRPHKTDPFYVNGLEDIEDVIRDTADEEITKFIKDITRLKKGTLIVRF